VRTLTAAALRMFGLATVLMIVCLSMHPVPGWLADISSVLALGALWNLCLSVHIAIRRACEANRERAADRRIWPEPRPLMMLELRPDPLFTGVTMAEFSAGWDQLARDLRAASAPRRDMPVCSPYGIHYHENPAPEDEHVDGIRMVSRSLYAAEDGNCDRCRALGVVIPHKPYRRT